MSDARVDDLPVLGCFPPLGDGSALAPRKSSSQDEPWSEQLDSSGQKTLGRSRWLRNQSLECCIGDPLLRREVGKDALNPLLHRRSA